MEIIRDKTRITRIYGFQMKNVIPDLFLSKIGDE